MDASIPGPDTALKAGAHDAAHALAMRAAGHASLGDAGDVAMPPQQLHIGADDGVGSTCSRVSPLDRSLSATLETSAPCCRNCAGLGPRPGPVPCSRVTRPHT